MSHPASQLGEEVVFVELGFYDRLDGRADIRVEAVGCGVVVGVREEPWNPELADVQILCHCHFGCWTSKTEHAETGL